VAEGTIAHWQRKQASKELTRLYLSRGINAESSAVVYVTPSAQHVVDSVIPRIFWTEGQGYCPMQQRPMREVTLDPKAPFVPAPGDLDLLLFARATEGSMTMALQCILIHAARNPGRQYTLVFMPRRPWGLDDRMRNMLPEEVRQAVVVSDFPWAMALQSGDVFDMRLPYFHRDLLLRPSQASSHREALASFLRQVITDNGGTVPMFALGTASVRLAQQLLRDCGPGVKMPEEKKNPAKGFAKAIGGAFGRDRSDSSPRSPKQQKVPPGSPTAKGKFHALSQIVIIDRAADVITALLHQLTYGGAVFDFYETIDKAREVMRNEPGPDFDLQVDLAFSDDDDVWRQLQDVPLVDVSTALNRRVRAFETTLARFQGMSKKDISATEMAQEVTIGSIRGRITEQRVRRAIGAEHSLIRSHQRLIAYLTAQAMAKEDRTGTKLTATDMMRDMGFMKPTERSKVASRWARNEFEANLYSDAAYDQVSREGVAQYIKDVVNSRSNTLVEAARVLALTSACSLGLHPEDYEMWLEGSGEGVVQSGGVYSRFGHEGRVLISALESVGLLRTRQQPPAPPGLAPLVPQGLQAGPLVEMARHMQLMKDGQVYPMWKPLAARLVEMGRRDEWPTINTKKNQQGG